MLNQIIKVQNIEKSFGSRKILRNANLEVSSNQIIGLLGPNGSGKTTLFYIIAGLIYPDKGLVLLNGEDIKEYPMYKRAQLGFGYLPQDTSIFRSMNVANNIDSVLQMHIKDKKQRLQRLDEIIEQFSISHIRESMAMSLSGGEKRRVEIARTIAANPRFVLFDEPFAGVDPIAVADLRELICSLKQNNIGILITDHNVLETLNIVDKAYILYDGEILFEGNKSEIMNNDLVRKVYLGSTY